MAALLVVFTVCSFSFSSPSLEWSIEYFPYLYSHFTELIQASTGDIYISGWASDQCLFKVDPQGELLWSYGMEGYGNQKACDLLELSDGTIAVTGTCRNNNHYSFFVAKVTPDGQSVWERIYDINPEQSEYAHSIDAFPDGNMMVCGSSGSLNLRYETNCQAYVMYINPNGDLIWDGNWGNDSFTNFALRATWSGRRFNILAHGTDGGTGAPHVLWFSPDGTYLGRERINALASYYTGNGLANSDEGFTFTSNSGYVKSPQYAILSYVDSGGRISWSTHVEDYLTRGMCVTQTAAGNYLYGGGEIYYINPGQPWWTGDWRGVLYLFNELGEKLWYFPITLDECERLDGVIETSSGSILACGGSSTDSYLYCFEDDTGIEESPSSTVSFSLYPNPFSDSVSMDIKTENNPENIHIMVMDIAGRTVYQTTIHGQEADSYSASWTPGSGTPRGYYIITVATATAITSKACLLL
ncbi:hypothetical protein DRQ21_06590 [Candidatus Fermentibacteria bacterium]|nr:MAG: hypothetical protein DRQ21_06590 [Candidatus Fermentibacteria bacterium]